MDKIQTKHIKLPISLWKYKRNSCLRTQLFWPKKRQFTSKTQPVHFTAYFKALEKNQNLHLFLGQNDLLGSELSCDFFWIKFKQNLSSCPSVCENIKEIYAYEPNYFGQKHSDSPLKSNRVILLHISRRWRKTKICTFF